MKFGFRLKKQEHINELVLFLGTDEQQEFLERAQMLQEAKDFYYSESGGQYLLEKELVNEKKYNYLLDKAIILSRLSNEDRLSILLLTYKDQEDYINGYLNMRRILESDEVHYGNSEFNIEAYNALLDKAKIRYDHRSLLGK